MLARRKPLRQWDDCFYNDDKPKGIFVCVCVHLNTAHTYCNYAWSGSGGECAYRNGILQSLNKIGNCILQTV